MPDFCNDSYHVDIININVASQFLTHITTSFWFAFVLSFPYLIFEVWRFVSPALYQNEKRSVGLAFTAGTFMFFLGCAVGYTLVFPFTFRFLTEYRLSSSIVNQISLTSYMGTQAQAIGAPRLYAGLLGRADRVVLSTLFPLIQFVSIVAFDVTCLDVFGIQISWMEIMMLWFAVVGNVTAIQRAIITWRNLGKMYPPEGKDEGKE